MRSQMMQMPTGTIDVAARWFTPLTATNVEDDTIHTHDTDITLNMLLSALVLIELSHQILNVYCIIMTEQEMALAPEQEMALAPEQEMALVPEQEMA